MEYFIDIQKVTERENDTMYRARNIVTKKAVFLRGMKQELHHQGIPSFTLREISLLKELKHRNIQKLENVIVMADNIYLVLEYLRFNLKIYLNRLPHDFCMTNSTVQSYVYQITSAVAFCHQHGIFHRDLRPENILISNRGVLKIANFERAREFKVSVEAYKPNMATLWYTSPELLLGSCHYSPAIDIWAIACIFAEILLRKPLFRGNSRESQLHKIFGTLGLPDKTCWPNMVNLPYYLDVYAKYKDNHLKSVIKQLPNTGIHLLKQMLKCSPVQRIPAKRILQHPYFSSVSKKIRVPIIL